MTARQSDPLETWVSGFNDEQLDAYEFDGHCAVLAGPGSGKTKVLVAKVGRLLTTRAKGPRGVACVTYNNETVRELHKRLSQLGYGQDRRLFIGTVHSFCLSCVVVPFGHLFRDDLPTKLTVASSIQQRKIFELAVTQSKVGSTAYSWEMPFQNYRRTHPLRDSKNWKEDPQMALLIETYEALLRQEGLLDFDDMVIIALDLIRRRPFVRQALEARFPYLVVDEYQDLGYPLHAIVRLLMRSTNIEIFAVGDPDQSIYGFAGADPKYLRELARDSGVHRVELKMNYRCAQRIIDGSQVALALDEPHKFVSARGDTIGELFFFECPGGLAQQAATIANQIIPRLNALGTQNGQIAILYIDKLDAGVLAEALEVAGIKFAGERDLRYPRTPLTRWLEDIGIWCSSYPDVQDSVGIGTLLSTWIAMKTDAGVDVDPALLKEQTEFFSYLVQAAKSDMPLGDWLGRLDANLGIRNCLAKRISSPDDLAVWDDIVNRCEDGHPLCGFTVDDFARCGGRWDTVTLTTLHSSKGLEYQIVIMPGLEQGRLPGYAATSAGALAEARRVFYVGMTRTKDVVYLLYSGWYENRYGAFRNGPSQFVLELLSALDTRPTIVQTS
jgi:DNA helicase-2/ATP-dependent DNA helicase PcrA